MNDNRIGYLMIVMCIGVLIAMFNLIMKDHDTIRYTETNFETGKVIATKVESNFKWTEEVCKIIFKDSENEIHEDKVSISRQECLEVNDFVDIEVNTHYNYSKKYKTTELSHKIKKVVLPSNLIIEE